MIGLWIVIGLLVALALFVILGYNSLVRLRVRVQNAWSQIDVQLRRRYDLIPNLIETVKGYATHERELFEEITRARTAATEATGVQGQAEAENRLTAGLRQLFAVAENYPDLKASQNFLALQEELTATESRIAFARQFYNDSVAKLNTRIQAFPTNLLASMFRFVAQPFFEIDEGAAGPVPVRF